MRAALLQPDTHWEQRDANLEAAGSLIARAARGGADVAVLPEMFATGFTMNVAGAAEDPGGRAAEFLSEQAASHGINLIAGLSVRGGGALGRNLALVFNRGGELIATYEKMHPFTHSGEHLHYGSGGAPVVFELDGMPATVLICYDLRFPEALREVAPSVEAAFYIANWPSTRAGHWDALLLARAIENQCFVAGVNRRGMEPSGVSYIGGSALIGPTGERLCRAGEDEDIIICEFEPSEVRSLREEFPFIDDIRSPGRPDVLS